jgi:hypothetical protein
MAERNYRRERLVLKLSDFVRETITEIVNGVQSSKDTVKEAGGQVGGLVGDYKGGHFSAFANQNRLGDYSATTEVNFDVAVTTSDESGKSGGAGIFVAAIGIGGKSESVTSNTTVSRIQFTVPLVLP